MNTFDKTVAEVKSRKIPMSSAGRAIQYINDNGVQDREYYTVGLSELVGASVMIEDVRQARLTYLYFVQEVVNNSKRGEKPGVADILATAKEKALKYVSNPNNPDPTLRPQNISATPKLDCLGNPKRKKGAKQEQAVAVYKANANKPKAEIIQLFMDEVGMSKAGATTYYYNVKKLVSG